MQQALNTLLDLLKQGIAAIFKFFQVIYTWAFDQIMRLSQVHFGSLPLWKQILTVAVVVVVAGLIVRAGKELWEAGERILHAFTTLLTALVHVLPWILGAGIVAFLGLLTLNNVNF